MQTRRTTALTVLIAGLAHFAGACSSSDSESATTTTEQETTTTTVADDESSDSGSTVSDEEFEEAISGVSDQIDETGGDTCGLLGVLEGMGAADLPDPSTPVQVEAAVALVARLYTDIATAAPPEYAAEGETIAQAMVDLETQAAENDYDPEWFNSDGFDPFASEEVSAALTTFATVATEACAPTADATDPGGATAG